MRIGILSVDRDNCLGLFNSAAEQLLGYRAREVRGKPCVCIFADSAAWLASLRGMRSGDPPEISLVLSARHQNGRTVWVTATAHLMLPADDSSSGGGEVLLVFEDALERKRRENQLLHSNRMQSLDHFAAGIMHEIRNPLASISTNVQHMMENTGPHDRFHEEIQDILADVRNIEEVTRRVLDYAHPDKFCIREAPVEQVVEEVLRFSRMPLRRQGVRLSVRLDESPAKVRMNVSQIKQVVFNIVRNAWEAMPGGGELHLSTSHAKSARGGGHVRLDIEDTGRGIAEEHLDRIFDPFFSLSTEGNGLGLAISRRIVEEHGGRIEVWSQVGKGTRFGVILPAV